MKITFNIKMSLDMGQKLDAGHYGPALTVNVIPQLDGNKVKDKHQLQDCIF